MNIQYSFTRKPFDSSHLVGISIDNVKLLQAWFNHIIFDYSIDLGVSTEIFLEHREIIIFNIKNIMFIFSCKADSIDETSEINWTTDVNIYSKFENQTGADSIAVIKRVLDKIEQCLKNDSLIKNLKIATFE